MVGLVPGIGNFLSLLHMAMLYALYSFEYKWIYQGISHSLVPRPIPCYMGIGLGMKLGKPCHTSGSTMLSLGWIIHQRVNFVEKNWPYFLGFGLPLAILTSIPNSLVIR